MSAAKGLPGVPNDVLQAALGDLADEAYTEAKKLTGTALVSSPDSIDTGTETFVGQLRWNQPIRPTINVGSLTNSAPGALTHGGMELLRYVKTARSVGSDLKNLASVVTQKDGLAKFARDQTEFRAQDESDSILSVLKGVALSEALIGAGTASGSAGLGGQNFDNDPRSKRHGFYVDLGTGVKPVSAASAGNMGSSRADSLYDSIGMAFKDYEPPYAYLITSPSLMSQLRSANQVDEDRVVDGNIELQTVFQGKLRLVNSRVNQSFTPAEMTMLATAGGVALGGKKISFIVLPGAVGFKNLNLDVPVEIDTEAASHGGFGTRQLWYRWGYVAHPAGYDWLGDDKDFVGLAEYQYVLDGTPKVPKALASATAIATATGTWRRAADSVLTLGILPIFHD